VKILSEFSKNKRKIVLGVIVLLLVVCVLSGGRALWGFAHEKSNPVKTVAFLMASDISEEKVNGVKQGLNRYGFSEGENANFILENAHGDNLLLPKLAQELIKAQPDVIVVTGDEEATVAKNMLGNQKIPIVFVGVGSPVDSGLVNDLLIPGGNVTGVESCTIQLSGKRLEYFKRLLPSLNKITVLYDPAAENSRKSLPYLEEVAKKLNLKIAPVAVTSSSQAIQELQKIDPEEGNGAMLICSIFFESVAEDIEPVIYKRKIPLMGAGEARGIEGLFASYGMPYYQQGEQASRLVSKVLNGENPAFIPVESPSKVELMVNTDVIKSLGLDLDSGGLALVNHFQ